MFFRKKPKKRVEPRFESAIKKVGGVLAVTDDDRAAPAPKRKSAKKKAPTKTAARKRPAKTKSGTKRRASTKSRKAQRRNRGRGLIGGLFYWSFIVCIWAGIGVAGIFAYYGTQMPSASTWEIPDRPPNVKIVSVSGDLVANRGATGGAAVGLHDMSPYIPQAIVAIEDRRYYSHFGFDPIGFGRAMTRNVIAGRLVQGGSTITQQLAKNLFLEPDKTIGRKIQEAILALWLETRFSKDEILEMYLNRVYFGAGAYGVDAAARRYFEKSAAAVNLGEAALLAGLLKAPSRLSPNRNPEGAQRRAQIVLAAMSNAGFLSESEAAAGMSMRAGTARSYWSGSRQ